MKPDVVIPCFNYPPLQGVGALRWTNLAKCLSEFWSIEVLSVKRSYIGIKPFNYDRCPNFQLKLFNGGFLPFLMEYPWSPDNLKMLIKVIASKATSFSHPTDYAEKWITNIESHLLMRMDQGCLFIVTAAPYSLQYYIVKLFESRGYTNYILDFQDPWTTDPFRSYASQSLRTRDRQRETWMLNRHNVSNVFVTKGLLDNMTMNPKLSHIIENGHDIFDLKINCAKLFNKKNKGDQHFKLVYFGTLANGRDKLFCRFLTGICLLKQSISFDIYGRSSRFLKRFLSSYPLPASIQVQLFNPVPRSQLVELADKYDVGLQVNADEYPYLVSTKIYEYPALGLPVLCLCNYGEVTDMIKSSRIGFSVTEHTSPDELMSALSYIMSLDPANIYDYAASSTWKNRSLSFSELIQSKA